MLSKDEIGARVRALREGRGMSRAKLAARLGVSEDSVAKIERGQRVDSWLGVARMAEALGTSPNDLLGFAPATFLPPDVSYFAAALAPILSAHGGDPEDAEDIARTLLEAVEAVRELSDAEPGLQAYSLAGRLAARRA